MENTQDPMTRALDEALELTFPASDPIAITPAAPVNLKEVARASAPMDP
jgi:hypothetical protein